MIKQLILAASFGFTALLASHSTPAEAAGCSIPGNIVQKLSADFTTATGSVSGGLFTPKLMWGALVDRSGVLCGVVKVGDAWPGSRAIAIAKAATANDFSNVNFSLSTARLYGLALPGGSLFGLNESNTFNAFLGDPRLPAQGTVPGGIITFGGGLAIYLGGHVIGGLGVSGDTACADHNVAWAARQMAISQGVISAPPNNDDIIYQPTPTTNIINTQMHPHCGSTNEVPPSGGVQRSSSSFNLRAIQ